MTTNEEKAEILRDVINRIHINVSQDSKVNISKKLNIANLGIAASSTAVGGAIGGSIGLAGGIAINTLISSLIFPAVGTLVGMTIGIGKVLPTILKKPTSTAEEMLLGILWAVEGDQNLEHDISLILDIQMSLHSDILRQVKTNFVELRISIEMISLETYLKKDVINKIMESIKVLEEYPNHNRNAIEYYWNSIYNIISSYPKSLKVLEDIKSLI